MTRPAAIVLAAAALLAAAGCSGSEPAPEETREPGPAEAYLEAALGFTADDAAQGALAMEESIAACMADLGFEYVPYTAGHHFIDVDEIDPPFGSREFAVQYGYGFAAVPEEMRSETTLGQNPNDEIMAAMSAEQLEAYESALWGDEPGVLGGCQGAARDQVWGDPEGDPIRTALEEEIARIDTELVPTEPEVTQAVALWATCMADAGVPGYTDPVDAEERAWNRWIAFNDALAGDPELAATDPAGKVVGEDAIAQEEAAVATADWDCRRESGYDDAWRAARDRLQQEYVDAHRAELEAWVESFS